MFKKNKTIFVLVVFLGFFSLGFSQEAMYIEKADVNKEPFKSEFIAWTITAYPSAKSLAIIKEAYNLQSKKEVLDVIKTTLNRYEAIGRQYAKKGEWLKFGEDVSSFTAGSCSIAMGLLAPYESLTRATTAYAFKVGMAKAGIGLGQAIAAFSSMQARILYEETKDEKYKEMIEEWDIAKNFLSTTSNIANSSFETAADVFNTIAGFVNDSYTGGEVLELVVDPETSTLKKIHRTLTEREKAPPTISAGDIDLDFKMTVGPHPRDKNSLVSEESLKVTNNSKDVTLVIDQILFSHWYKNQPRAVKQTFAAAANNVFYPWTIPPGENAVVFRQKSIYRNENAANRMVIHLIVNGGVEVESAAVSFTAGPWTGGIPASQWK